jgi:ribosome maturation factor RimP
MQGFEAVEQTLRELAAAHFPDVFVVEASLSHGPRSVLLFLVDTDEGITIETCARLSRKLSAWLEEADPFDFPFSLEVGSPGLSRPLKIQRQYLKNIGRKLRVKTKEGKVATGLLEAVSDEGFTLLKDLKKKKPKKNEEVEDPQITMAFDAILEAKIEISFD